MQYILGILTGIVIEGFFVLMVVLFRQPVERTLNQIKSKVQKKGEIIEPEREDITNWVESLKSK